VRWILCGKNSAAVACLEYLLEQGDEVRVLGHPADDGRDGWQRSLRGAAERAGVPFSAPRINRPEVVAELAAFAPDALLSIQYAQILKGPLFRGLGRPCLNFHFALLPRHRGVAPVAWAILSGDREAGVTLHHMAEDIDAGDVIAQRALPIGPAETARELYERVSGACVELFRESHPFPPSLLRTRLAQDESRAVYHRQGELDFGERRIDWSRPAAELQRWLRAWIFPPLQYPETACGGARLLVARVGAGVGPPVPAAPGTVVASSARGVEVAARDGSVELRELLAAGPAGAPEGPAPPPALGARLD
jgi:methionyl-tRNA formyltransferase